MVFLTLSVEYEFGRRGGGGGGVVVTVWKITIREYLKREESDPIFFKGNQITTKGK